MRRHRLTIASLALAGSTAAEAGRPLDTDDAAVIPRHACQVETYASRVAGPAGVRTTEAGTAPSCNPFGSGEILLGVVRGGVGDAGASSIGGIQYKGLWRPVTADAPGAGFVAAYSDDLASHADQPSSRAAYVSAIASAPITTTVQLDVNVGWLHPFDRSAPGGRDRFVWRVAGEWTVSPRWTLVGEQARTVGVDRSLRIGAVYAMTQTVALDLSGGRRCQPRCDTTFVSAGLTWMGDVLPHGQ